MFPAELLLSKGPMWHWDLTGDLQAFQLKFRCILLTITTKRDWLLKVNSLAESWQSWPNQWNATRTKLELLPNSLIDRIRIQTELEALQLPKHPQMGSQIWISDILQAIPQINQSRPSCAWVDGHGHIDISTSIDYTSRKPSTLPSAIPSTQV